MAGLGSELLFIAVDSNAACDFISLDACTSSDYTQASTSDYTSSVYKK